MSSELRLDGRKANELRPIGFQPGFAPYAHGSVLVSFGDTRVICAASFEDKVPQWMKVQNISGGWITAEYSMLPYSTLDRKQRDISKGKLDGRTVEIQRLIGRALRAVVDLGKMPGKTLWVDCDVLQADGGTRTASITGGYVAVALACRKFMQEGRLVENPLTDSIAAVSVGIYEGMPVLDLNYIEDSQASVDANIVMTGNGRFVELQSSGEEATFSEEELHQLLAMGKQGISQLLNLQKNVITQNALSELGAGRTFLK